jgi:hypothetical protein
MVDYIIESRQNIMDKYKHLINDFIMFCKSHGVVLINADFEHDGIGLYAKKKNIVLDLNKNISIDDGLVNWDILKTSYTIVKSNPNYIFGKNYALLIHPLFDMLNIYYYTPSLMDVLWDIGKTQNFGIAINLDKVRINIEDRIDRPLAGWGAKFNKNIKDIPDGIAQYYPEPNSSHKILSLCFSNAHSLDIKWDSNKEFKTFQSEELKTKDITINFSGKKYYPARYAHAKYSLKENYFSHFDGAIHLYNEEEYLMRFKNNFNFNQNSLNQIKAKSIKLFKINGNIPQDIWVKLTSNFFAGNPLIHEYFEGEYSSDTKKFIELFNKTDP